ncbi:MAG: TlpA disulfide reductase family protein [Gammaproteobacteria bacterium]
MKKLTILLFALLLTGCHQSKPVTLYDLDDVPIKISKDERVWHIVNYWADWCAPCIKEIPALNEFEAAHSGKVKVLGVHADALSVPELKARAEKLGIQFAVLKQDPRHELGLKPVQVLPTTYVINPDGKILGPFVGIQSETSLNHIISLKG